MTEAAAPATDAQNQAAAQPNIQVVTQYIRDMSFENPNAPDSIVGGWGAPDTNVQVFLRHQLVKEDTYECTVNFRIEAKKHGEDKTAFIIDLSYGALVILRNIPKEHHQPAIFVEVPKLLFPFAREIVASATAQGGYPPLYLAPISFEAIYVNELKRLKESQQGDAQNIKTAGNA